MEPDISVVIPAYNESRRLPPYLGAVRNYFSRAGLREYEVIVVDDGSDDGLGDLVAAMSESWPELRLERQERNRGKGAAVRRGVLAAKGRLILFTDADGATPIEEEVMLRREIEAGADLAIGSRLLEAGGADTHRRWHRRLMGRGFATLVRLLLAISVRDTQCGFKMFRREVGYRLLGSCREERYLFDLHVLSLATRLGYQIREVSVRWRDVPGSKMNLLGDSVRMFTGLLRLRAEVIAAARAEARAEAPAAPAVD
jgi:dolichyl-phosphate beta-glucosyltransferase